MNASSGPSGKSKLPHVVEFVARWPCQLKLLISGWRTKPFKFHNRGNTAVVGRHATVFDFGRWKLKGTLAWFLWAIVHVLLLVNFEKRILVSVQWIWRYVTKQRGARLIDENAFKQGCEEGWAAQPDLKR